jgi:hypothetical protein
LSVARKGKATTRTTLPRLHNHSGAAATMASSKGTPPCPGETTVNTASSLANSLKKSLKPLLLAGLLGAASLQASAACYTIYDQNNRIAYQGEQAPIDMSLPLHEALAKSRYGGMSLVFDESASCGNMVMARVAPVRGGTPLLTDKATAQAMNVPYREAGTNIAIVSPGDAGMERPGVTVVPSEVFAGSASSQNYAQAGRPNTASMGAGPAPRVDRDSRGGTVITELRDPPMTVVQQGGVTISAPRR